MSGTIKIKLEGLNINKIVNALIDEGVLIKNLITKARFSIFEINENDELKLKKICKRYRRKYYVLNKSNVVNFIKKLKYYFGFCIAIILVVIMCFWSNLYIYKINLRVDGEEKVNLEEIELILNENGIKSGVRKNDLNINEIQKLIISTQKNVSSCTVKKMGGCLDIIIYPGILKENVAVDDLCSKFNAVITEVKIYAGKCNLKVGDIIKEGDLLIKNDNGASGVIKGKIYFSDYILYNENQIIKEKTGREFCETKISLFNKIINKHTQNLKFINYFEENCVFCISNNTFIPINLVKTKYLEFEYKEKIVPYLEVEDKLKQKLYLDVLSNVPNEYEITNVSYSVVSENNLTRLDCFIECEVNLLL